MRVRVARTSESIDDRIQRVVWHAQLAEPPEHVPLELLQLPDLVGVVVLAQGQEAARVAVVIIIVDQGVVILIGAATAAAVLPALGGRWRLR